MDFIPINTPRNISCSLQGKVVSTSLIKYTNGTLIDNDVPTEPLELIPGIVVTRDSPLLSIVFTVNTSNIEVAGLGCSGANGMIVLNVTIFGELVLPYQHKLFFLIPNE